ncbi:sodium-dependent lysophosphatidylcholine symporter 1-B isoform X1 [Erpetoichthys calabaricus]|uniref:MFSD2 lysolipid transporter A, lysophospholipid a n=1 Tax=Erpetoichthys calabaricus TaxID=27687 RepID=A0A8C4SJZ8_ERPCA|nr:sodium-dependent lysophosphatidylcholine symporter 1-B isoform X1 [Erpetoichthys calabaricus]
MAKGGRSEQVCNSSLLQSKRYAQAESELVSKQNHSNQLSLCSKICYAIGGAPYQITGCALGFFLQIYLLDVAQIHPSHASIILFVGRAWDAITDPTVGFFISVSPWTRFGQMMPWIVLSAPFAVASYILIWYVPTFEHGKLAWYLIFYCLFQSLMTCYHVPYSALTMFISTKQSERDSATAYRMTVEVLGTVLGTAIQGQIVGSANAPCNSSYLDHNSVNSSTTPQNGNDTHHQISLEDTRKAYLIAAGVIGSIYILCASVLFFGVKEKKDSSAGKLDKPVTFSQGLRLVMGHGPYVKLVIGFLFTSLAFMLLEGNFALFCTYTLGLRDDFQNILLVIMLSATLTIPFWQWFLTRFGKKTAVYLGTSWVVPFMILIVCLKSNLILAYLVSVASGISVAAAFFLPWSMLPDVLDDFKIKNPTSQGHEAIFYSFYVFFTKFASGISLGISTLSLGFAGYKTKMCTQADAVNLTLKILVCPAPIVLIILGLLIFKLYPINEKTRQLNKMKLEVLRDDIAQLDTDSSTV